MKRNAKKPLLWIIFLLMNLNLSAQEQIIKASYDKVQKRIKIQQKGVKFKKEFKIKVDSINSILHKVVFKFKDFQLISEAPSGLKVITDITTNENLNFGREIASFGTNEELMDETNKIIAQMSFFLTNFDLVNDYKKEILKLEKEIKEEYKKIDRIDSLSNNYKDKWIHRLTENFPDILCNNSCIDNLKKQINQGDYSKVDSILKELTKIKRIKNQPKYKDSLRKENRFLTFTKFKINYLLTFYETLDEQSKNLDDTDLEVIKSKSRLKKYYLELKKIKPNLLSSLVSLENGANKKIRFKKVSDSHLAQKDVTSTEVFIVDRFNLDTIAKAKTDLIATHKWRIDFSTGLSGNGLVQREYFFTKTDSLKTGISNEKTSGVDFGIVALMHFDCKLSPSFAVGPVIGASVSLFDEKPRFIVGGSGTIGKFKSFSVTAGINFGQVKVLSKQVSSNGEDFDKDVDLNQFENVPLTSKVKSGFFFGITYNLTRTKK